VPAAKLLVIEDNLSDIYILRHALGELREEFDLEIVSDGDVALQFVNGQRANRHDAKPCVIVLDLHFRNTMDSKSYAQFGRSPH
jgi:CheY-like chemotaxis protein